MLYVCKLEYCPENVRFTDILNATEICVISVEISFGKAPFYGRLCSHIGIYSVDNVLYYDPSRHI